MKKQQPLQLSTAAEATAADIAAAWERELPGAKVESIRVITTLWKTAKRLTDERARTLRQLGIDAATLDLLSTLRRAGTPYRLTTQTLAERCLVSAGAISQRLARAESEGLVTREPARQSRKSIAVTLTEAGHQLLEPAVTNLLAHEADLLSIFTETEREQLIEMLERLEQRIKNPADKAAPTKRRHIKAPL